MSDAVVAALIALGGVLVGQGIALLNTGLARSQDDRRRRAERSEDAAGQLLARFEAAAKHVSDWHHIPEARSRQPILQLPHDSEVSRLILDISDADARTKLYAAAKCLANSDTLEVEIDISSWRSVTVVRMAVSEVLGAIRRGEAIPATKELDELSLKVDAHFEFESKMWEEMQRANRPKPSPDPQS